jgi:hypothetical protein
MAILALDLASQSGWAVYGEGMDRPSSGSKLLKRPTGTNGEAAERLRKLLADKHETYGGFTDIVFEAQHIAEKVNPQTAYLLIGLGFMAEWFGHRTGARVFCCDIGTWRKHFMGRGSFKKKVNERGKVIVTARAQAKAKAIDVCNSYGWHPADDNAADACGILDYYLHILPAAQRLPMPWRDANFMSGYRA